MTEAAIWGVQGFNLVAKQLVQAFIQKTADVWKKDVWDFEAFSQIFLELRFSLEYEGKDGENLNSQTWPGTPRRPSSRHPQLPDSCAFMTRKRSQKFRVMRF